VAQIVIGTPDTWWHQWRPIVVDVSSHAGQTVDVSFQVSAGANTNGDDFVWGNPVLSGVN